MSRFRRTSKILFLAGILCLGLTGVSPGQPRGRDSTPFSIKIHTPRSVVKTGSALRVSVEIKNTSNADIHYGGGVPIVDPAVWDFEGKPAHETALKRKLWSQSAPSLLVLLTLHPDQTYESTLEIGKLYDLTKPGKYNIQVQRRDLDTRILVKSNTITVRVRR